MTRITNQNDIEPIVEQAPLSGQSTLSLQAGYQKKPDQYLETSYDIDHPFAGLNLGSVSTFTVPTEFEAPDILKLFPERKDNKILPPDRPEIKFDQNWKPDDWQLSASTHFLFTDNMAGFYNDGISITGLEQNADGNFQIEAGGFSTAWGSPPINLELSYVRKRPTGDHVGEFKTLGPSFTTGLSYQKNHFSDYGYRAILTGDEFAATLDGAAEDVANDFGTGIPIPDYGSSDYDYYMDLQDWFNDKVNNIPGIIGQSFSGYDPQNDYELVDLTSDPYNVSTFTLDTDMCLESSVWRYDRRVNLFHGGKGCLEGSAVYFAGDHFEDNLYLGIGPHFEFTVLSYHQKPFRKLSYYGLEKGKQFVPPSVSVSSFVYADAQYLNGFRFDDGFDENNRFVTANIGVGLRTTIPSFSKRKIPVQY